MNSAITKAGGTSWELPDLKTKAANTVTCFRLLDTIANACLDGSFTNPQVWVQGSHELQLSGPQEVLN